VSSVVEGLSGLVNLGGSEYTPSPRRAADRGQPPPGPARGFLCRICGGTEFQPGTFFDEARFWKARH